MEGEVELGQIVDISDSIASFSEIENQSIVPESQAEISESKYFIILKLAGGTDFMI